MLFEGGVLAAGFGFEGAWAFTPSLAPAGVTFLGLGASTSERLVTPAYCLPAGTSRPYFFTIFCSFFEPLCLQHSSACDMNRKCRALGQQYAYMYTHTVGGGLEALPALRSR